ncbi:MAG: glycosyltransferase family 4 protein, partial [Chitinispirillaceae bacterium]|nr:glycosyltransferase family 4 protein [Chitinispirillaceae bacterium]
LPWHLTLAGSGGQGKKLSAHAGRIGIGESVSVRTGIDDKELSETYRAADLFVFPSRETASGAEGFGIALLEAMAHGVPVVASRTGGIPEVLGNGACGVLVEPGSAAALAGAIARLAGDVGERKRLSAAAFERLRKRYAWNG